MFEEIGEYVNMALLVEEKVESKFKKIMDEIPEPGFCFIDKLINCNPNDTLENKVDLVGKNNLEHKIPSYNSINSCEYSKYYSRYYVVNIVDENTIDVIFTEHNFSGDELSQMNIDDLILSSKCELLDNLIELINI